MLEIQDIRNICPAEFVDGLVVITDHAEISVLGGQKAHKHKLSGVGVLVLVHHDVAQPVLIALQHIRIVLEKLHSQADEIVKIHSIIVF